MTKAEYYARHKTLWSAIVKELIDGSSDEIVELKRQVFERLWPDQNRIINAHCWACDYYEDVDGPCLLKTEGNCEKGKCLDGVYEKLCCSNEKDERVSLAEKIRDWPMRED